MASLGQRPRIASIGTVAWVPGALGSFSSMCGFAAKFTWFNHASLDEFHDLLMSLVIETIGADRARPGFGVQYDIADLSIWHLARALGESGDTLRSLSRREFVLPVTFGPVVESLCMAPRSGAHLRLCPECIKNGFHSCCRRPKFDPLRAIVPIQI